MNCYNKTFKPVSNNENEGTSEETIFHNKQEGDILSSEYSGGQVVKGHLIAKVDMKYIFTIILIICCLSSFSQSIEKVEKELKEIESLEQIEKLKQKYPQWQIEVLEFDLDKSNIEANINTLNEGEIKTFYEEEEKIIYKVLEIKEVKEFRVSHIYFNGKELSLQKIDSLRTLIIEKYRKGIPFSELSKQYSSYKKPNDGDLGWFKENVMVSDFESAVKKHKKGDVFKVDIPSNNWYYVVLKTYEDREIRSMKMIKVIPMK